MLVQAAEESYQRGLVDFAEGRRFEAMARFEAAIELETRFGKGCPQARYLAHYGLCLALVRNEFRKAVRFCQEAVVREGYNADLRLHMGRVLMLAGRRKEAHATFLRGLNLQPDHPELRRSLKLMGVRKRPPLPFLPRQNPLNVLLGRIRKRAA